MTAHQRKFSPPRTLQRQIERPRLIEQLIRNRNTPLTILSAPAGYGKSTLLRQAAAQAANEGAAIAWLNCDPSDREAENFIASLHHALIACDAYFADFRTSLGVLAESLEAFHAPVLIILDDYDTLKGSTADDIVEWLTSILPSTSRLLIGARSIDEARVAKLILEGAARTVDATALSFSADEASALLQGHCDEQTIDRMIDVAEGWPIMLQLARIKSEQRDGNQQLLHTLLRPHSELFGYLAAEVLSSLSTEQQELLTCCSIVDYIDKHIAFALTGIDRAEAILSEVTVLEPLVSVQPTSELTIGLHPVMREFLVKKLVQKGAQKVSELHGRAATHFTGVGETFQAIRHALAAEDSTLAAEIFEQIGGPLAIIDHGPAAVWSYLSQMPRPAIEMRPTLKATRLIKALVDGDGLFAQQAQEGRGFDLGDGDNASPLSADEMTAIISLGAYLIRDCYEPGNLRLEEIAAPLEVNMRRKAKADPRALLLILPFRFFLECRYGSIERAEAIIAEYESICEDQHYAERLPSISPHYGVLAYAKGDFESAVRFFSDNLSHHWDSFVGREELLVKLGNSFLAKIFYEQNRIDDAIANIKAMGASVEATFSEIIDTTDVTLALCLMQSHGAEQAIEHLDRTRRQRELYGHRNTLAVIDAIKVSLLVRIGRFEEAKRLFKTSNLIAHWEADRECFHWNWLFVESFVRACGALSAIAEDSNALCGVITNIRERAATHGRDLAAALCDVFLAQVNDQNGDRPAAVTCLRSALSIHAACGALRPYLDAPGKIAPILESLLETETEPVIREYASRVFGVLLDDIQSSHLRKILTAREGEVLVELAKGHPTKLIARNLAISPETVKHHLKNIFSKLGVENRRDAVSEAYRRTLSS